MVVEMKKTDWMNVCQICFFSCNLIEKERQQVEEHEEQLRVQKEQELEAEKREAEKKRPKMNIFSQTTYVSDFIAPRPSQYALRRLEDFEYLKLWYLSQATLQQ